MTAPLDLYRPKATTPTEIKKVVGRARAMLDQSLMTLAACHAAMALTDADAHDLAAKTGRPVRYGQDVLADELAALSAVLWAMSDQLAFVVVPASAAPCPSPRLGNPRRDYQADG